MELYSWLFMRISGVVLIFLVLGHLLIMNVLDGGVAAHQLRVRGRALVVTVLADLGSPDALARSAARRLTVCESSSTTTPTAT